MTQKRKKNMTHGMLSVPELQEIKKMLLRTMISKTKLQSY